MENSRLPRYSNVCRRSQWAGRIFQVLYFSIIASILALVIWLVERIFFDVHLFDWLTERWYVLVVLSGFVAAAMLHQYFLARRTWVWLGDRAEVVSEMRMGFSPQRYAGGAIDVQELAVQAGGAELTDEGLLLWTLNRPTLLFHWSRIRQIQLHKPEREGWPHSATIMLSDQNGERSQFDVPWRPTMTDYIPGEINMF